jgi:hypothetical protein
VDSEKNESFDKRGSKWEYEKRTTEEGRKNEVQREFTGINMKSAVDGSIQ